jgi:hypothetical protein
VQDGGASESVKEGIRLDIARMGGEVLANESSPTVFPNQAT